LAGSADEMGTFIQELSVHFREQAANAAEIQSQLNATEQDVESAVSKLTINEKEKRALQKQIQNMQTSSRAALSIKIDPAFGMLSGLHLINPSSLFGVNASLSTHQCIKCGKNYPRTGMIEFGPFVCPECRTSPGTTITINKQP
jgi:hypothetical protein